FHKIKTFDRPSLPSDVKGGGVLFSPGRDQQTDGKLLLKRRKNTVYIIIPYVILQSRNHHKTYLHDCIPLSCRTLRLLICIVSSFALHFSFFDQVTNGLQRPQSCFMCAIVLIVGEGRFLSGLFAN